MEDFAPGLKEAVVGQYIKSPVDLEEIGGLVRGNLMHIDMSIGQMFMLRPLPDQSTQHACFNLPLAGLPAMCADDMCGGN